MMLSRWTYSGLASATALGRRSVASSKAAVTPNKHGVVVRYGPILAATLAVGAATMAYSDHNQELPASEFVEAMNAYATHHFHHHDVVAWPLPHQINAKGAGDCVNVRREENKPIIEPFSEDLMLELRNMEF